MAVWLDLAAPDDPIRTSSARGHIGFAVECRPLRLETWSFQVRWLAAARRMRQGSTTA
jgi:hypothetical protein